MKTFFVIIIMFFRFLASNHFTFVFILFNYSSIFSNRCMSNMTYHRDRSELSRSWLKDEQKGSKRGVKPIDCMMNRIKGLETDSFLENLED